MSSQIEQISRKYGWPLMIHCRGDDAYMVGCQPLASDLVPIYRWPEGDSIANSREQGCSAEVFHCLKSLLKENPAALYEQSEVFKAYPSRYRELALYAMECVSSKQGTGQVTHRCTDAAGWIAHHITKAVFEEQEVFDAYHDKEFIQRAAAFLPWYVWRYTGR